MLPLFVQNHLETIVLLTLLLGGGVLVWGWFFRERGEKRRRCPRCWYDMSRTPSMRCSECGYEASDERRLFRRRRGWRRIVVGIILVCVIGGILFRTVQRRGWLGVSPTWTLLMVLPHVDADHAIIEEFESRRGEQQLRPSHEAWLGDVLLEKLIDTWPARRTELAFQIASTATSAARHAELWNLLFDRLEVAQDVDEKAALLKCISTLQPGLGGAVNATAENVELLMSLLKNEPELRGQVSSALWGMGPLATRAIPLMIRVLDEQANKQNNQVALLSTVIGIVDFNRFAPNAVQLDEAQLDILLDFARGTHPRAKLATRKRALITFSQPMLSPQQMDDLWRHTLSDPDTQFVIWALGMAGVMVTDRNIVATHFDHADEGVQLAAIDSIFRSAVLSPDPLVDEAIEALRKLMRTSSDDGLRLSAFLWLRHDPAAVDFAVELLSDPSPVIAQRSMSWLLRAASDNPKGKAFDAAMQAAAHPTARIRIAFLHTIEQNPNWTKKLTPAQQLRIADAVELLAEDQDADVSDAAASMIDT